MVLSGKKRTLLLIPVIIILFTLWVHYTRVTANVRIGVSLDLSETADLAELHTEQGIELAADILNEKGGINGRRIEIIALDNKGNEKGSEIAAENAARHSLNWPFRFKTAFSDSSRRRKQKFAHHYSGTCRYRYVDRYQHGDPLQLRVYLIPHFCRRGACHGRLCFSKAT